MADRGVSALTQSLRERFAHRTDSEHLQVMVRIGITLAFLIYLLVLGAYTDSTSNTVRIAYAVVGTEFVCSVLLMAALLRSPKASNWRRWVGMLLDYSAVSILMVIMGERASPLYVVLLWVTVGNGLRYGDGFLRLAVVHAVVAFAAVFALTPYWRSNPFLGWGLLLGLVAIPAYFSSLLRLLRGAIDRADRANAAKTRFVATMSHELRSPLNTIIGMSEVLSATRMNPEQRSCAEVIQTASQTLLLLVEDVLNIAAIEAGKLQRHDGVFSLRELIRKTRTMLYPLAQAKELELIVAMDGGVPDWVHGDAGHLMQVLLNLLNNAIKFTDTGSVQLLISSLDSAEGLCKLRFSVRDTGVGIPVSERERIFKAFEQVDSGPSKRRGGTGLGISIAKTLVDLMGGRLWLEENPGGGTHFWADLEFVQVPESASVEDGGDRTDTGKTQSGGPGGQLIAFRNPLVPERPRVRSLRILVADDLASNRNVLLHLLDRAGHTVVLATNGEEALDALAEQDHFDAAIIDLHMPEGDGMDVLRQARLMQTRGRSHTPIIVLSADVKVESIRAVQDLGAFAFLSKPLVIEKLLDMLAHIAGAVSPELTITPNGPSKSPDGGVLQELIGMKLDRSVLEELLGQCVTDAVKSLEGFERAGGLRDWGLARDELHALHGVAVNLGAQALADCCGALLRNTTTSMSTNWQRELLKLRAMLDAAEKAIHQQLAAQEVSESG